MVTCLASDIGVFWQSLLEGRSGIRRITSFDASEFPCQIAGEVQDFDPTEYVSPKLCRRISRASQMALVSAEKAIQDAGLPNPMPEPERVGVYHGTAVGGFEKAEQAINTLQEHGLGRVNPFALPSAMLNMPAFHITQRLGAKGPSATFSTACATGTQSVGEAAAAIRLGRADVMLAGGVEALITHYTIGGFSVLRILPTSYNDEPERAAPPSTPCERALCYRKAPPVLCLRAWNTPPPERRGCTPKWPVSRAPTMATTSLPSTQRLKAPCAPWLGRCKMLM
jgi:3-oxoacyl-[acyl-carrier-protein] synthase II